MDYGTRYMHKIRAKAEEYRKTPEFIERERLMSLAADMAEQDFNAAYPDGPTPEEFGEALKFQKDCIIARQKELGVK